MKVYRENKSLHLIISIFKLVDLADKEKTRVDII